MLNALWSHNVSQTFAIVIAACFAVASLSFLPAFRRFQGFAGIAPGLMTSLGILGTFVGIFLGLLDFKFETVNESLPTLLEGLKVAFGTSILGLAAAVLFRGGSVLFAREATAKEDVGIEDIVAGLDRLDKRVGESNRLASAGFDRLGRALSDDNDTSIVGQLQRLRSAVSDAEREMRRGFEAQVDEFKRFAEHMSAAFSEAIIKELQAVIREFNERLSEQFGENFNRLNEAVGRLVEWQDEYRRQMEELKVALDSAFAGIQMSREALGGIESSAANIPTYLDAMERSNRALNDQIGTIAESLGGVAEMRDKAVAAFPEIRRNIETMTEGLREAIEEQTKAVAAIGQRSEEIVSSQAESAAAFAQNVDGASAALQAAVENVTEASANAIAEHRQAQEEMLNGLQSSFNETIQGATTRMNEAIGQLDQAIQDEIGTVVQTMAQNLSGMAERFVDDYQPLLDATKDVVELGRRATRDERRLG